VSPIDPISVPEAASPLEGAPPLPVSAEPMPLVSARVNTEIDLVDVVLIGAVTVISFLILGIMAAAIFMAAHRSQHLNSKALSDALAGNAFFVVPTQFVIYMSVLGFMALLVWVRHNTSLFQAIHWNPPDRRLAIYALTAGIALAFFSEIGEVVLHAWIPKSLPITEYFKDRPSALLLAAFGVLVAPLMEEILFRGFLYPALARWTGAVTSILLTAIAFTLLHGAQLGYSWAPLLLIFVVGMALTVTRAVTKSVATCVLVHMAYNFALMAQSYILTHGFRQMQGS